MSFAPGPSPREVDLVQSIAKIILQLDGTILLGEMRENLCRAATPDERARLGARAWVVESQGLPNLVHELVHALFLGELADDHGFDYGWIPLDLARLDHRLCLWEELACCVISAELAAPARDDRDDRDAFRVTWFAEQFEIQGVFHGLEDDLDMFRARVDAQLEMPERLSELRTTVERGIEHLDSRLSAVGCGIRVGAVDPLEYWRRYRARGHA